MENIIINFEANSSGLEPGINALQELEAQDKALASQAKKTAEAYKNRDASVKSGAEGVGKTLDSVSKSFQGLNKSIAGGTFAQTMDGIKKQLADFGTQGVDGVKKVIAIIEALEAEQEKLLAAQQRTLNPELLSEYQQGLEQTQAVLKVLYQQLDQMQSQGDVFDEFATDADKAEDKVKDLEGSIKSLQARLKAKKQDLVQEKDIKNIATLNKEIEDLEAELKKLKRAGKEGFDEFGNEIEDAEPKFKSMRLRLKELKVELQELEDQGKDNTAEFEALAVEAGKLEDQIGDTNARIRALASDTFVFDALMSGIQGVVGAVSIAQGVTALWGAENEELNEALLKVNAAMAILQGLQALQNVLQKQSAASIGIELLLRRRKTAATVTETIVTEAQTAATIAGEAAQKGFNITMLASPTNILLVGITAIAAAFIYFSKEANLAEKKLTQLNERMLESIELTNRTPNAFKDRADKEIKALDEVIEKRKAEGASDAEIMTLQIKNAEKRADLAKHQVSVFDNATNAYISIVDQFEKAQAETTNRLIELTGSFTQLNLDLNKDLSKKEKERLEQKKALVKSEIDLEQEKYDRVSGYISDYYDSQSSLADLQAEFAKRQFDDSLKSAQAYADARVIIARRGSKEEVDAQIAAIKARQRVELNDPNLTSGERFKIEKQGLQEITDLRNQFEIQALKNAQKAVDAKVLAAKEGTREELDFQLQSLELGYQAEIQDKQKSVQELLVLDNQYLRDRERLIKAYNQKVAQDAINTRIAEINSSLSLMAVANVEETNQALLDARKRLIDEQAALDVISIQNSILTEEQRRVQIKAVYDKALEDKRQLEKAKTQAEIDNGLANSQALYNAEKAKAQRILDSDLSTAKARRAAQEDFFKFNIASIDAEKIALEDSYKNGLISFDEYWRQRLALQTQYDEQEYQQLLAQEARKQQAIQVGQQIATGILQAGFNIVRGNYNEEEQRIRELYDMKKISEEEYNERSKQLRRQQDQDAKAQAFFNMMIQQGPMLIKGFQTGGLAGVGAAASLFFSLLSLLTSTEPPGYFKGKILIPGPGTETSDSIPARLSKNESVINAASSKKHTEALRAINDDRFDAYLMKYELPRLYENLGMPNIPSFAMNVTRTSTPEFDYERMGEEMGKQLANMPQTSLSFDERGFLLSVKQNDQVTTYKNKKLSI